MFLLWKKFICKEKVPILIKIAIIFSIIGTLVEVLAPGNSVRMKEGFPEFATYGIIEKITYRVDSIYDLLFNFKEYGVGSLAFFIYIAFGMIACISYGIANKEKNIKLQKCVRISSVIVIVFIAIVLLIKLNLIGEHFNNLMNFENIYTELKNNTFRVNMLESYGITSLIIILVCHIFIYQYS